MGTSNDIVAVAAKQGGFVTRDQLLDMGLSPSAIDRRVRAGDLSVVAHGTYQVFAPNDHIDLLRGAVLTLPNAVVSHQSAAHLLHFPWLPKLEPSVTVASHTTHKFPGVTVHRSDDLTRSHLTNVDRLRVTNVLRTAFDLAAFLDDHEFAEMAEALLLADRMQMRHLQAIAKELSRRGKPGSRLVKQFIAIREATDPRATALERKGRAALAAAGLPPPIPQYPIPWDPNRRFDDAFPPARLAIEWDSRSWHLQMAAMEADRRRDLEAALHRWFVARYTWQEVTEDPGRVGREVAALLADRQAS
ncbi:MAG: type IV toxin-antitoxin system AbiEi family antitoxin domain-containing protein [Actinomycetota bacterium]